MTPFRSDVLAGKRILVTGGGTGLGKEISRGLAQHGAHVFICGRREQVLKDTCEEIRSETQGIDRLSAGKRQGRAERRHHGRGHLAVRALDRPHQQRRRELHRADGEVFRHGPTKPSVRRSWTVRSLRRSPAANAGSPADCPAPSSATCDVGLDRIGLCGAVGDGEDGRPRDDNVARRGVGAEEHPPQCRRARAVSDRERVGEAQSNPGRGRRRHATRSGAAAPVWRDRRAQEPDDPVDVGCLQLHQRRDHRHRRRPSSCGAQPFADLSKLSEGDWREIRETLRASTGEERKGRGV